MGIATEINKSISDVFRRAYIKRRDISTGLYESSWYEITDYVKRWSSIKNSIDDVRLNNFKHSGITLNCRNDDGAFNPQSYTQSIWNGYMTRFRTLLKIEAGYEDSSGNELPTTTTQGVFILTNDPIINAKTNEITLQFKSLVSIFDEVLATDISNMGGTQTASDLITKIKDHTDGSGNYVFQQFITASGWTIQTTTSYYNPATTTSLDGLSCWELMNKLAEAESYILLINRQGDFEFRDRDERTSTSQFHLKGLGFREQNIIGIEQWKEPINKFFNYFRLKYEEADTSTSYVTSGTTTSVNPSVTSWQYGVRKYEFENELIDSTTTAQSIVDNLYTTFSSMKEELNITCKFLPQLEISDLITLSYRSYDISKAALWDTADWDVDNWSDESDDILSWDNIDFKILSKHTNLDKMTTSLVLRRVSA